MFFLFCSEMKRVLERKDEPRIRAQFHRQAGPHPVLPSLAGAAVPDLVEPRAPKEGKSAFLPGGTVREMLWLP